MAVMICCARQLARRVPSVLSKLSLVSLLSLLSLLIGLTISNVLIALSIQLPAHVCRLTWENMHPNLCDT